MFVFSFILSIGGRKNRRSGTKSVLIPFSRKKHGHIALYACCNVAYLLYVAWYYLALYAYEIICENAPETMMSDLSSEENVFPLSLNRRYLKQIF